MEPDNKKNKPNERRRERRAFERKQQKLADSGLGYKHPLATRMHKIMEKRRLKKLKKRK